MSSNNRLTDAQKAQLDSFLSTLQPEQLAWVEGYVAGLSTGRPGKKTGGISLSPNEIRVAPKNPALTILYGTHTGRSEGIARNLSKKAISAGVSTSVFNMQDYNTKQLKKEQNVAIIVSTHGEGDPPVQAEDFWDFVRGKRAPKLDGTNFSVLALGDKSYEKFCQTGVDIDEAFRKNGANPILPIVKCDVDFESDAEDWTKNLIEELSNQGMTNGQPVVLDDDPVIEESKYSKTNPFYATILDKVVLNGAGSSKEVMHIELSLEDSGLHYHPGDSIGIYTDNPPELVDEIVAKAGFSAHEEVEVKAGKITFEQALRNHLEITVLNRDVLKQYAELTKSEELLALLGDRDKLNAYLYGHDLLDLIVQFPGEITAQQLVNILRKLPPRMYSISSSEEFVPEEVHITVAAVRYEKYNRKRKGAASTFLADRCEVDDQVPVFIDHNPNFKLPENTNTPVIMVGPGTGIAPFRSFLQQSEMDDRHGRSWLFFGDQHFFTDFLYQVEWQKWLKTGHLEKLDVAFSRDQDEKVYVQHRMYENKTDLFKWLEKGAIVYVCGDMKHMAKDVENTLVKIIQEEGKQTEKEAKDYIKNLHKQKRYQLDVY